VCNPYSYYVVRLPATDANHDGYSRALGASQPSLLASNLSFGQAKGADPTPAENRFGPGDIIPESRATSSRNGGRDHFGTVGDIISEWWAGSFRHAGRLRPDFALFHRNTEPNF
jgi:hypothetical protein